MSVRIAPNGLQNETGRIDISDRLISLRYVDEETAADKASLSLDNYDTSLWDEPAFKRGAILLLTWGYPGALAPERDCIVTKITGGRVITCEARARSILMNTVHRARRFESVRRSDVIRQIAREAGYGEDEIDIEETSTVYPSIQQARHTDAQLCRRLADLEGFQFYVDSSGFHWHSRRVGAAPVRTMVWFNDDVGQIIDYSVMNDITGRPGRSRARGRDPIGRADIDEPADDSTDTGRTVLAPIREIVDPETGASRIEREIGNEETHLTTATDAASARAEARGRFRRVQQLAVQLKLNLVGDATLLAKTVVDVSGLGRRLSQRYYIKKVTHTLSTSGYTMEAEMISDGHGGHSTESRRVRGVDLLDVGSPASGHVNQEPAAASGDAPTQEGAPLEPVTTIDEETGEARTTYRATSRAGGSSTIPEGGEG